MNTTTQPSVTPQRLMQFAWGYAVPLIIEAGLKHRVFDVLDTGAKTVDELAGETGASRRGLSGILNTLVAFEFLAKDAQGRYSLTAESAAFLVSSKPSFQGGIFRHISKQLIPNWLNLSDIVASGAPEKAVNQQDDGSAFFEKFVEDIFPMSYPAAQALGDALKIAAVDKPYKVLDVAAGSGVWGIALAQKSKQVRVTALDWAGVIPVTKRIAKRFEVADRFTFVEGDMHTADCGSVFDLATLGHILHSEGVERSRALLKRVFGVLAPGGTIAIQEFLANDARTGPPVAMIFAVNMLVNTDHGDTFTFPEISKWLDEAGFVDVRQIESPGPSPLILATKAK